MTITLGTQKQVDTDGDFINAVGLTSNTGIAFYSSGSGIQARHMTLAAGFLTVGSELTIDGAVNSNLFRSCKLTSTSVLFYYEHTTFARARVITVSGTTLTANAVTNLTDFPSTFASLDTLSATAAILVYTDGSDNGLARILSVAGTTVTENASFTFDATGCFNCSVTSLTSAKAVVCWIDGNNSDRPTGEVLDIAGAVITGNADTQLSLSAGSQIVKHRLAVAALSSSACVLSYYFPGTQIARAIAFTEAGGALTAGADTGLTGSNLGAETSIVANSATKATVAMTAAAGAEVAIWELSISGTTITEDDKSQTSAAVTTTDCWLALLDATNSVVVWEESTEAQSVAISGSDVLTLAPMTKPADVDASGTFIYLALLNNGTPILTKISTALSADGTTVFNPGSGDDIGVECSRFNANVSWVAGRFNSTNVVEKSEDAGSTFEVKDNATFGVIKTFVVGPDSDDRVLIFDVDDAVIRETINSGIDWFDINEATSFDKRDMGRLGINVQEIIAGNDGGANNSVQYSVNSGAHLEDFQDGDYSASNATKIIVN